MAGKLRDCGRMLPNAMLVALGYNFPQAYAEAK